MRQRLNHHSILIGLLATIVSLSLAVGMLIRRFARQSAADSALTQSIMPAVAARDLPARRIDAVPAAGSPWAPQIEVHSRWFRRFVAGIEMVLIILMALAVNWRLLHSWRTERIYGSEFEWLTSSAHYAYVSLREFGYIPLWQPNHGVGEPLIDSPFSFVLNPLSAGPTLLMGPVQGMKVSVALYTLFAGLGGWFLARVLRLGLAGRLLLAMLMIGKGNMLGMVGAGYYQLGVSQAYFPWIAAAALATLRQSRRWPVVLLAVAITLQFWAGNIWYTLPAVFSVVLLTIAHVMTFGGRPRIRNMPLRRMILAAVLTIGLSAVTLLPILLNADRIGRHNPERDAGWGVNPIGVAQMFVDPNVNPLPDELREYNQSLYFSYVVPAWFLVLVLFLLPPVGPMRALTRWRIPEPGRVWLAALIMLVGSFIWGVGGNPIMIWIYDTIPFLARWRFVGRALAVTSFWLAFLVALRIDHLWLMLSDARWQGDGRVIAAARTNLAVLLLFLVGIASYQVTRQASLLLRTTPAHTETANCLAWLRQQFPDRYLAVSRQGYDIDAPYIAYGIRKPNIEADYFALPMPSTLSDLNMAATLPEFAMGWTGRAGNWVVPAGYQPVVDSPRSDGRACLYRASSALSYAFTIPLAALLTSAGPALDTDRTAPITDYWRRPDRISLPVEADSAQSLVIVLQEGAYPGWQVTVDGQPGRLESVGGFVGVVIPPGTATHQIVFAYRPPLFFLGGAITMLTWAFCMAYLLQAERIVAWLAQHRRQRTALAV